MFNLHVCLCWHLALWPLGVFRCWRLPRNTHRCLRAIYMRSINPPKIEDLSRSTTLMHVPTGEEGSANYINVVDANTGDIVRRVYFSNRSHDTLYPLSGPIFQETKATDGSGHYLYLIDPSSYAVSQIGPYSGILGPYAVDGTSSYAVNNVTSLWG